MPSPASSHQVDQTDGLAIGISLTTSYGAISVRDANGVLTDIGRVDNDNYLQIMKRLSLPSSRHRWSAIKSDTVNATESISPSPPYSSLEDMWLDMPRQQYRAFRKSIWLPASSDVRILARMIKELLSLLSPNQALGDTAQNSATITFANVGALYEEDVRDAAAYVGLPLLHTYFKYYEPRELFTAYAGHSMGICSPEVAHDKERCEAELRELPHRYVFLVEYTKKALLLQVRKIYDVYDNPDFWFSAISQASFELGSNAKDGAGYSDKVMAFIRGYLTEALRYLRDTQEITVLITGDADTQDIAEMENSVMAVVEERGALAHVFRSDPEYVTARGAAEIEWRALTLQNSAAS